MKPVQARIDDDLHAAAMRRSKETGVSVSHVIRRALEAWAAQYDPQGLASTVVVSGLKGDSFEEQRQRGVATPGK